MIHYARNPSQTTLFERSGNDYVGIRVALVSRTDLLSQPIPSYICDQLETTYAAYLSGPNADDVLYSVDSKGLSCSNSYTGLKYTEKFYRVCEDNINKAHKSNDASL